MNYQEECKNILDIMKYIKKFNESDDLESKIEDYLKKEYPTQWFDSQLQERVYEYIGTDEAEDYDGDPVKAYKNLSTGGAVEYDLLDEMVKDVCEKFGLNYDDKILNRTPMNIVHDHLMDHCTWKDNFIFNRRSTEPYKSPFGNSYKNLMKRWDDDNEIKL